MLPPGGLLRGATLLGNGVGLWVHPGPSRGAHTGPLDCFSAGEVLVDGGFCHIMFAAAFLLFLCFEHAFLGFEGTFLVF